MNKELSNLERNEVELHTIDCKFCSDAIEGFEKTTNSAKGFLNAKSHLQNKNKRRPSLIPIVSAIAAVILVALLITDFSDQTDLKSAENKLSDNKQPPVPESENLSKKTVNEPVETPKDSVLILNNTNFKQDENLKKEEVKKKKYVKKELELNYSTETDQEDLEENEHFNINIQNDEDIELRDANVGSGIISEADNYNEIEVNEFVDEEPISKKGLARKSENAPIALEDDERSKLSLVKVDTIAAVKSEQIITVTDKAKSSTDQLAKKSEAEQKVEEEKEEEALREEIIIAANIASPFAAGEKYFQQKEFQKAIGSFKKTKKQSSQYYQAQLFIGKCYIALDQKEKARNPLKIALEGEIEIRKEAQKLLNQL